MRREILEIPEAAARLLDASDGALAAAGRQLRELSPRYLTTIARGSSDHAAAFLKYVIELTAGVPVASLGPSIASIYGAKLKLDGSACLTISQSGKSPDIVAMAETARAGGALTIAHHQHGRLAACRGVRPRNRHPGRRRKRASRRPRASSTRRSPGCFCWRTGLMTATCSRRCERLPEHLRKAIDCDWMPVAGALTGENSLFILGRGPSAAIANEAALKFKETCAMHAEAYSAAEVMHGPLALVGQGFPVVALAARDASEPSIVSAADLLVRQGRVGLHHVGARRQGADAAACRDRPSDHRSADADRILLRLRRGLRAPSRPQPRSAAQFAQGDGDAMSDVLALSAKRIFDGEAWHEDAALIVRGDVVDADRCARQGSGRRGNDRGRRHARPRLRRPAGQWRRRRDAERPPDVEGIETICRAHAPFGTTALLPTLITDTPEVTAAAVAAGIEAARRKVPGFAGLHLEGPHLSHRPQRCARPEADPADDATPIWRR